RAERRRQHPLVGKHKILSSDRVAIGPFPILADVKCPDGILLIMFPTVRHCGNNFRLIVDARRNQALNHRHNYMMFGDSLRLLGIQGPWLAADGDQEDLVCISLPESQTVLATGAGCALYSKPDEPNAHQACEQQD